MILSSDKDRAAALEALQKINSGKKEDVLYGFEIVNSLLHTIVNSPAMFKDVSEAAYAQNRVSRTEFYGCTEIAIDNFGTFVNLGTARKCDLTDIFKEFFNACGLQEMNLIVRDRRSTSVVQEQEEDEDEDTEDDDEEEEEDEF